MMSVRSSPREKPFLPNLSPDLLWSIADHSNKEERVENCAFSTSGGGVAITHDNGRLDLRLAQGNSLHQVRRYSCVTHVIH